MTEWRSRRVVGGWIDAPTKGQVVYNVWPAVFPPRPFVDPHLFDDSELFFFLFENLLSLSSSASKVLTRKAFQTWTVECAQISFFFAVFHCPHWKNSRSSLQADWFDPPACTCRHSWNALNRLPHLPWKMCGSLTLSERHSVKSKRQKKKFLRGKTASGYLMSSSSPFSFALSLPSSWASAKVDCPTRWSWVRREEEEWEMSETKCPKRS